MAILLNSLLCTRQNGNDSREVTVSKTTVFITPPFKPDQNGWRTTKRENVIIRIHYAPPLVAFFTHNKTIGCSAYYRQTQPSGRRLKITAFAKLLR